MISSVTVLQSVKDASRNCLFVVFALASFFLIPPILAQANTNQPAIGSEDELAVAVRKQQEQAAIGRADSLVFTATFRLSDKMELDNRTRQLMKFYFDECKIVHWSWSYRRNVVGQSWLTQCVTDPINGVQIYNNYLEKLITIENGKVDALQADLICMSLLGFSTGDKFYPGPIKIIACDIATQYTVNRDQSPCSDYWIRRLCDLCNGCNNGCDNSFVAKVYRSLHPVYRGLNDNLNVNKGKIRITNGLDNVRRISPLDLAYTIESQWAGKFPSTVKVTIDLTPMRDKLYKVKPTQNNE